MVLRTARHFFFEKPMFRIPSVFIALAIFTSSSSKLAADDLLNSNESRWIEMLLVQLPQVSEIQQRTALATTVAILARAGRDTEATHIAMQQANDDTRNSLLISIAASLAQQSAIESALSAVNKISEPISKERALHEVARALASEGELERAETFIQGTSEVYFKDRVISEICEYLARERRIEEALARSSGITDTYRKGEVTKLIERMRDGTPSPLEQLSGSLRDRIHILTSFSSNGTYDSAVLAILAAKAGDRASAMKHIRDSIGDLNSPDVPPKKIPTAILIMVALVELGDEIAASNLVEKLYESVGKDWSGLSTTFGSPSLLSLLVRLERFDAIDRILERECERFKLDPAETSYFFTLESLAESLVEQGRLSEFEARLASLRTPEERLYLLLGAIVGADYAQRSSGIQAKRKN